MSRRTAVEIDTASPPSCLSPEDNTHLQGEEEANISTSQTRGPRRTSIGSQEVDAALLRRPRPSSWTTASAVHRYFSLSGLAVLLTVACPGKTSLWQDRAHAVSAHDLSGLPTRVNGEFTNYDELQWLILMRILLFLVGTEILFIRVVQSDPGYVSFELMNELDRRGPIEANDHNDREAPAFASSKELHSLLHGPDGPCFNDVEGEREVSPPLADAAAFDAESPPSPQHQESQLRQRRPYCDVCQLEPPLRAHHCRACHKCVATFDHHCPLVGNCVGERNRAIFVAFLFAQAIGLIMCARVILSSRIGLETLVFPGDRGGAGGRMLMLPAMQVVVTELYVIPIAVTAVVMAVSHTVMVACNITTFEIAKSHRLEYMQPYDITDCPFSSGLVQNIVRAAQLGHQAPWVPFEWSLPPPNRSSTGGDWWNHIWRNKYWSCC